jgi:DNA-binding winged helix-turn-helix (wHTH) protein/TolB-like protein/Flp pilus assembly protein TadD
MGAKRLYAFGGFRLDPAERRLLRDETPVPLTPKCFDLLVIFVENSGHLIGKEELIERLWPNQIVEEANLSFNISTLRKALGQGSNGEPFIETVPKKGFRFVAHVEEQLEEQAVPSRLLKPASQLVSDSGESRRSKLRYVLAGSLVILLAAVFAGSFYWRSRHGAAVAKPNSIAVLPFKSIGSEKDDEYLELGMADALITRLSNLNGIVVRPTSSVSKYIGSEDDAVTVGRALAVDSVLDGSVQKVDERIRITVRLIRVKDAMPLWAATFDEKWTDVLSVQSSIAQKTVGALALQLTGEERSMLSKRYTDNLEAYQLYLKGRYSSKKTTPEGFWKAIEYYNQAIALDRHYALAYAGLADCYYWLSFGMPPREVMPKMKAMAMKAVEFDESLAEAHSSLSIALAYYDLDWSSAEKEIKRAMELNPGNFQVHLSYGDLLSSLGRFDDATVEFKKAQELDPTSTMISAYLAYNFVRSGDYDRAIEESLRALDLEPDAHELNGVLGFAYLYKGEPTKALAAFQKIRDIVKPSTFGLEGIGRSYAAMGERNKSLNIIDELREASKREYVSSFPIATIYLQLGDKNKALEYLEKTYEERNTTSLALLKTDRQFDVLRSDPRFITLLRKLNLPT